MKKSIEERLKNNYIAAKEAYKKGHTDFFNDPFYVYTELLFDDLCDLSPEDATNSDFYQVFYGRLKKLIEQNKDIDIAYLSEDIKKTLNNQKRKKYEVYFGIPLKMSAGTPLPFGKIFTLDDVKFKSINKEVFSKLNKGIFYKDLRDEYSKHILYNENLNFIMLDFHFFKTSIAATSNLHAARLVGNAFDILHICATVAQESSSFKYTFGSTEIKSRTPIPSIGYLIVVPKDEIAKYELFLSTNIQVKVDTALDFTKDNNKLKKFKSYINICNNQQSPIQKRIKLVLFEFAKALRTTDPHLRQLGFWRCLEIATAVNGQNRIEKKIIQIVSSFYSNFPHWLQEGKLILKKRNLFVHEGIELRSDVLGSLDRYLNWSQHYASSVLSILLWMNSRGIGKLREGDINDFFDLYTKTDETLKIATRMLNARKKLEARN